MFSHLLVDTLVYEYLAYREYYSPTMVKVELRSWVYLRVFFSLHLVGSLLNFSFPFFSFSFPFIQFFLLSFSCLLNYVFFNSDFQLFWMRMFPYCNNMKGKLLFSVLAWFFFYFQSSDFSLVKAKQNGSLTVHSFISTFYIHPSISLHSYPSTVDFITSGSFDWNQLIDFIFLYKPFHFKLDCSFLKEHLGKKIAQTSIELKFSRNNL